MDKRIIIIEPDGRVAVFNDREDFPRLLRE